VDKFHAVSDSLCGMPSSESYVVLTSRYDINTLFDVFASLPGYPKVELFLTCNRLIKIIYKYFLISSFRRVLYVVCRGITHKKA